jgi:mRNA-degrading endonuclease RelE of RelBE toxin-antitoxin system
MNNKKSLQTVVETPEFIKQAKSCMDKQAKDEFISYIAQNPFSGDLISGTGGARKIRWQNEASKGKRGGVRIIYYFYDKKIPIFLFTAYGKSQKANLSQSEKSALGKIIKQVVETYEGDQYE